MNSIKTATSNATLGVDQGFLPLHLTIAVDPQENVVLISYWEPNDEERAIIAAGGKIKLSKLGHDHPAVKLEAEHMDAVP